MCNMKAKSKDILHDSNNLYIFKFVSHNHWLAGGYLLKLYLD